MPNWIKKVNEELTFSKEESQGCLNIQKQQHY